MTQRGNSEQKGQNFEAAPWCLYRQHICESLAKWCSMCDAEATTRSTMQRSMPSLFRKLTLYDLEMSQQLTLVDKLADFHQKVERLLPQEYKECALYALMLVERGFSHGVFINTATALR